MVFFVVLRAMLSQSKWGLSTLLILGVSASILLYSWKGESFMAVYDNHTRKEGLVLNLEEEQNNRLNQLHKSCMKYRFFINSTFYKKHRPLYLSAPKSNWTVCKVGKIGSTFWSRFFYILTRNGRDVYKVRYLTREDLHTRFASNSLQDPRSNSTRLILTVRNPYARLFSAYIDRIFTTSTTPLILMKNKHKCKSQITFQEFLQNVVDSYNKRQTEYHWIPLFHQCKPCEIDPTLIVKIETLKSDFALIMNRTELEPYKTEILYKAMAESTEFSINTLVVEVLDVIAPKNIHHARDCQTMKQISLRLWEALKIQGYIAEKAIFPLDMYNSEKDYNNSNILRNILVETLEQYPLTKQDVLNQRQRALNKFYRNVDRNTIEGIKKMYSADFELFGYSNEPPPW